MKRTYLIRVDEAAVLDFTLTDEPQNATRVGWGSDMAVRELDEEVVERYNRLFGELHELAVQLLAGEQVPW